jgi:hypothetical protein
MKNRLFSISIPMVVLLGVACGSNVPSPEAPLTLRGIQFVRKLNQTDSATVAKFGQLVAVIRRDSAMVILTNVDLHLIAALPGVGGVCQSLGTDSTANIEVELGVGPAPIDSAISIVLQLGTVHFADSIYDNLVDGIVPAYRLREFDRYPLISYLFVVVCPFQQALRGFDPLRTGIM